MAFKRPRWGILPRLLISFLLLSIIPLIILGYTATKNLSDIGREAVCRAEEMGEKNLSSARKIGGEAIKDSVLALDQKSTEAIELRTCELAQRVADFLYERDKDLLLLASFPPEAQGYLHLIDLLEKVLPGMIPSLFPYSTQFAWLSVPLYRLPNEAELMGEKKKLQDEYQASLSKLEVKIDTNRQGYEYLHDLLKETGSKLVKAVEKYLNWLGFENVINVDETEPGLKEEDLRIENERGLLVIEAKGIGGTSTDSDCSQISKIKYRRAKERDAFDVFGLYLVNHQRYLPPEKRMNPPFNETQIEDARNDERGLLTTYQLFKLHSNVTEGYITKEDARNALYQTGLVRFQPSKAVKVPAEFEVKYKGHVIIFHAGDMTVKEGMSVILCDSGRCRSAEILEVQVDGQSVKEADSGEIGIRLSEKASKTTEVWLRVS